MKLDELFALVPAPNTTIDEHLREDFEGSEIDFADLLEIVYMLGLDDEDTEALEGWSEEVLAKLLAEDEAAAIRWCSAAIGKAWALWEPVLAAAESHDATVVGAQVAIAVGPSSSAAALSGAVSALTALPSRRSPPPYAGHFYGALHGLLDGRVQHGATRFRRLAACLSYACVAPDGRRLTEAIAGARA